MGWEPDRDAIDSASTEEIADAIKAARKAAKDPDDETAQRAVDIVKDRFGK